MDYQPYIRLDNFKQEAFKKNLKVGDGIINIFESNEKDEEGNDHLEWIFVFTYKETLLTFYYSKEFEEEDLFITNSCNELKEVIAEFEDLCSLQYKLNKYNDKFINFTTEQILNRYAEIHQLHYEDDPFERTFQNEVKQLISKVEKKEEFPMDFLKFHKIIMNTFIPKLGKNYLTLEDKNNHIY